jgi:DNA topoisomerase-3
MGKKLIIAEKPSVAADIVRALGKFAKKDDHYENDEWVVSSAIGHLVEIGMPADEEVKRGKWTFAHLPAIPSRFDLKPIEKNADRLRALVRLLKRKDVDGLINACDAGREGELIFRYIVQYAKASKPIQRLWLQSMTPAAIREAFSRLRTDEELRPLADAAVCRSEADWLVGINGTRAMTAFNSKSGGFQLTTVGRVQSPTLAILVEREERIRSFRARTYWELVATFAAEAGEYTGRWFDEGFRKDDAARAGEVDPEHLRADRLWDVERARAIERKCAGKPGAVEEESKPATQIAPQLFDLTSLQREGNSRFGFSARTTLSLAQALYEKHKALTYPRTDSRALPEDYLGTVRATMEGLAETNAYGEFARRVLGQKWIRPNKRIFDNAKVSDHFAIIPTLVRPKSLNELEQKLYDLVVRRFLAIFFPPAEYTVTTRITRVEGEPFRTEGRVLVNPGWLAVYGREAQGAEEGSLVAVRPGETVDTTKIDVNELQTRPPARYNEATLLAAMEGAGKLIEDEELREAMREKGLGTPATRAQIIENLIVEKYVLREGKELIPTAKAFSLLVALRGLGIPELFSPELTAEWEFQLKQMEHGALARPKFMAEIVDMTKHIVRQAKNYDSDTIPGDFGALSVPCPKCGGEVHENYKKFQCQACDFGFWKILGGRQLEIPEAEALLRDRQVGPLDGFRSRQGRAFSASLRLTDEHQVQFDFGGDGGAGEEAEAPDFSSQQPLGACPKCGGGVFEMPAAYVCERAVGPKKSCDFRSGRTILQKSIERAQMERLLANGRTDLLTRFISKKGRAFNAFLVRQPNGSIGFEFEKREPRTPKTAKARATARTPGDAQPAQAATPEAASGAKVTPLPRAGSAAGRKSAPAGKARTPASGARAAAPRRTASRPAAGRKKSG